jgi:hypothetical protein
VAVDTNLQAVLPGDSTSGEDDDSDDASASTSSFSSESEDGAGSESEDDRVANDPGISATGCSGDDGDKKQVSRQKRKRKSATPTIVMDLQLGSFQDNPAMALVAHHDQSEEEGGDEESEDQRILVPQSGAEATMLKILSTENAPPGKKPKRPIITEVGP